MKLDELTLSKVRQKLELRKQKAAQDAFVRDQRAKILEILYDNVPKQDDNKKRTEAIVRITGKVIDLIYG